MTTSNLRATKDADAIRAVVHEETAAFFAKDFARWAACFLHAPRTQDIYVTKGRGVVIARGWDDMAASMKQLMEDNPRVFEGAYEKYDFEISVSGDMAWTTFNTRAGPESSGRYRSAEVFETRILERVDGKWLIVYSSVAVLREPRDGPPIIQVDGDGRVIWASEKTLAQLEQFGGLTVSAGKLRAQDPRWDAELQAAIARASGMRHVWDSGFSAGGNNQFHFPCILGDREGVLHCTVFVMDGMINVSFDDDALIGGRIEAAAAIFGLSEAQKRLAHEVSNGLGLTDAAQALGISVNTARTHLTRIYAKTGVNSQVALVRMLMSMAALPYQA
ncbi:MAG: DUF4440 domain-containing protein [Boseongicola sp.]|nr:DUF4440 domain-containing protein [Boseongicola sp.]NNJ69361.1 DUF4440 domain-containing protein [Boseongicola sp.]